MRTIHYGIRLAIVLVLTLFFYLGVSFLFHQAVQLPALITLLFIALCAERLWVLLEWIGPVVGTRTWGGVIGFDNEHELIDGTQITVPRLAFWFEEYGWGVENHGIDPDVEVIMSPDDWAAERDTQLETAVRLALQALQQRPRVRPPDTRTRPSKRRPPLPPRV